MTEYKEYSDLMAEDTHCRIGKVTEKKKQPRFPIIKRDVCPECGLPYGICNPEGVGHYRG